MTPKLKTTLRYSIGILLALIFLYFAFKGIEFDALLNSLANANYFWLLAYLTVSISSHVVRAYRWQILMNHIKEKISIRNLFSSVMIGYMVNNFIPRGGEIARPYTLSKLENISVSSSLATVIVERVLDILTLLILVIVMLFMFQEILMANFPWLKIVIYIALAISILGVGFLVFLALNLKRAEKLINKFTSFLPKAISEKIESLLNSFLKGLLVIKDPKDYFKLISITLFMWFLYSFQYYVAFYAFGMVESNSLTILSSILLNSVLAISIMIPVPGGIGTYHAFCIQALTGLFFVNRNTAAAFATATNGASIIAITIIGLYFLMKDNMKLSNFTKKD